MVTFKPLKIYTKPIKYEPKKIGLNKVFKQKKIKENKQIQQLLTAESKLYKQVHCKLRSAKKSTNPIKQADK